MFRGEVFPNVKSGDAVRADHINTLVRAIRRRTPINSPTVDVVENASGFALRARPGGGGGGGFRGLWHPTRVNDEAVKIGGGIVYDGVNTHIVADATVAVSASALNYIYLVCELNPTFEDGYVAGGTLLSVGFHVSTSPELNTNTHAYILLHTWQEGALVQDYAWFGFGTELLNRNVGDVVFNYGPL